MAHIAAPGAPDLPEPNGTFGGDVGHWAPIRTPSTSTGRVTVTTKVGTATSALTFKVT